MRREFAVGLIILASLAGCSSVRPSSTVAASEAPPAARRSPPSATPTSPPAPPEATSGTTAATAVIAPAATDVPKKSDSAAASHAAADRIAPPSGSAEATSGRAHATTPAATAKPAAPPAPKAAAASTAPNAAPASPSLDLTALEQRLRDTHAIGLFTKLSLKNQVDDLLGQVRAYYRGHGTSPPLPLRPRYDGLLLKVLSVLQDGDPPLAAQIWSSREAIWGVLADPAKVEKILG
ncbi:MAG TPA: hypothetical protein VMT92_07755 [Steroidobacteraceae bacterium]|nr:hypothetical protein [Steroidobacteraceae bacterium]